MAHRKPAHEIRIGKIRAAIWENETQGHKTWFSVSLSRAYMEGNVWKDSTSFGRDDLPVVAELVDMAYAWIWDRQRDSAPSNADE